MHNANPSPFLLENETKRRGKKRENMENQNAWLLLIPVAFLPVFSTSQFDFSSVQLT